MNWKKAVSLLLVSAFLVGCASSQQVVVKKEFIYAECPQFKHIPKIDIYKCKCPRTIKSEWCSCLSKEDTEKLIKLFKSLKIFNKKVQELNIKNQGSNND